jgi:NNP family nitrate/nitrite transporter-like MFS transporter
MLGALGGFVLPPAFGVLGRWSGSPQVAFVALLVLTLVSLGWLHGVVSRIKAAERSRVLPQAEELLASPATSA